MAQETMYSGLVNSPETTITNNVGVSDTLIYVLDPARVPSDLPNLMTIGTGTNAETVLVESINDSAITVQRGFQGIAKEWPAGTIIARNFTAYDHDTFKDNIEDLDDSLADLAGASRTTETVKGNADAIAAHLADAATHLTTGNQIFSGVKTISGKLNGAYAYLRNGAGDGMFSISNSLILLYAVDKTTPANYIVAIGYKGLQGTDTHVLNIIKNNVLTLGAANNQGTQVINGGDYDNILFYGISIPI